MVIVWGSRLYGKTDEVPGLFHVATKFGHLWYVPLIPMGSYLVLRESSDSWSGLAISFSAKSMLLAWGRAGSFCVALFSGMASLIELSHAPVEPAPLLVFVISLVLFLLLKISRKFRHASYERALELGGLAGLNNRGRLLLEAQFGHVEPNELPELMAKAESRDLREAEAEMAARKAVLEVSHPAIADDVEPPQKRA